MRFDFYVIRYVQWAVLASTSRRQYEEAKSDFCHRAPNSNDMGFFQIIFCLSSRVGNWLAAGRVSSQKTNSKWSKK